MSGFEWTTLGLILFGMVIPFWAMVVLMVIISSKQSKRQNEPSRVLKYNELMDYLHSAWKRSNKEGQNGASIVASIRELKNYPEHRDLTILYLEEITVTGTSKFDDLAKAEIKHVEAYMLGLKDD